MQNIMFCGFAIILAGVLGVQTAPWENPVRVALRKGEPVFALGVSTTDARTATTLANLGFDFLWIEQEHGPVSLESVSNLVLATRGSRTVPFVRVPAPVDWMAKPVLDSGALGVVFPHVNTAEDARRVVQACKFPPLGHRGVGTGVGGIRWASPEGYYEFANRNVMTIVIVEEGTAVENVEAIAATPGLEMVFIGTTDLSASLGVRGQPNHPKMQAAIERIIAACKKNKVWVGTNASPTVEGIKQQMAQGLQWFFAGYSDTLLNAGAQQYLGPWGKDKNRVDWTKVPLTY